MSTFLTSVALLLLALSGDPPVDPAGALELLPPALELKEEGPQEYSFLCDYTVLNEVGEVTSRRRIRSRYTRNLRAGMVRWNDVFEATVSGLDDEFPEGSRRDYMEGFEYNPSVGFLMFLPIFFRGFPNTPEAAFTKNLVWDTHMLENFGRDYFPHLKLNEVFRPKGVSDSTAPLAGMGTFKNRNIELTWIGVSRMHGELCALIRYEAYLNRFEMKVGSFEQSGTSHYWGEIWVSLEDKQVEQATLNELVSMGKVEVLREGILKRSL